MRLLVKLIPSGLPYGLTVEAACDALRRIRPRDPLARTLPATAAELVALLRHLDRRIDNAAHTLSAAVTASQTTLTELLNIGDVVAAKILARTGADQQIPDLGRLRLLLRRRIDRGLFRRRRAPPAIGEPATGN
jgi:hypothetical protein